VEEGGEIFYNTIDDIIKKPDTLPFVFEVFYFCLSQGFRGRYPDNQTKINEYKHRLDIRIQHPPIPRETREETRAVLSFSAVPIGWYVGAAALSIFFYAVFRFAAVYV
jgi:type VI protein secretion system component VasF